MKKIFIVIAIIFAFHIDSLALDQTKCGGSAGTASASNCTSTTDCSNPATKFSDQTGYTCNYTDTPLNGRYNICAYIASGGVYSIHAVINCYASTSAPINSGLIFLIIAGAGSGFFFLRKESLSKKPSSEA